MQINITGKNFQVTPAIRSHAEEKFQPLNKRFSQISNIHVVLHIDHLDQIAEATVYFHGSEIHATAKSNDMYAAIDGLVDKLTGQIHKQKDKTIDSHRQPS